MKIIPKWKVLKIFPCKNNHVYSADTLKVSPFSWNMLTGSICLLIGYLSPCNMLTGYSSTAVVPPVCLSHFDLVNTIETKWLFESSLTLSLPIFLTILVSQCHIYFSMQGAYWEANLISSLKFEIFYIPLKSHLINIKNLKYESRDYFEHHIMSVKQGTSGRLGEGSKSPIGDVGSLL